MGCEDGIWVTEKVKRALSFNWHWSYKGCELPDLTLILLEEQKVILSAKIFLQSRDLSVEAHTHVCLYVRMYETPKQLET